MKADQERVKVLLIDTVTLLCRNGLNFQKQLKVQGVLGITVDDTDVFVVHINEIFNEGTGGAIAATGHTVVAARAEDQAVLPGGSEPYYMTSLIGTLPQFTQNPLDGSIQMIGAATGAAGGTVNVAARLNNTGALVTTGGQKHKASEVGDDGRVKRPKAEPTVQQLATLQGLQGAVIQGTGATGGAKLFTTCTALPRVGVEASNSGEFQMVQGKDDKMRKLTAASSGNAAAAAVNQALQQQQWQFTTVKGQVVGADKLVAGTLDPTQCYMQYTDDPQTVATSGSAGGKKKVSVYPSLSVPTVSFVAGMNMAQVDFNSAAVAAAQLQQQAAGRADGQAVTKLWDGTASQQAAQQQQLLAAGVFDPMGNCAPWAVSQLMTSQGLLQADDNQQTQESIQLNQLGMLGYTTQAGDQSADAGSAAAVATETVTAVDMHVAQRGSKESRRSWTSKHKPHTCAHPGCRKSYFFVHDLRRHLRQKHGGMDYNDALGKYEPAETGDGNDGGMLGDGRGTGSPMTGHHHHLGGDDDDGSPDESDDNEEDDVMAMALTGSGNGKEVAT